MIKRPFLFHLLVGLSLLFPATVQAIDHDGNTVMRVVFEDDNVVFFPLKEHPTLSWENGDFIVETVDGKFAYDRKNVREFRFENQTSGIHEIGENDLTVSFHGNMVAVAGAAMDDIQVSDIKGLPVFCRISSDMESVQIDFSELPKDLYIISIKNHKPIKFFAR